MVEVKNIQVFNLDRAINAVNNSFNIGEINTLHIPEERIRKIATKLGNDLSCHQSHDAWLKGVLTSFDIKGNGVFMPEFQRYAFISIIMSQSSMHSMKKFMTSDYDPFTKYVSQATRDEAKKNFEAWDKIDPENKQAKYEAFEILVHNLPRGFELWATCTTNYLQLKTIVIQRFHHKNKEDWGNFIKAFYDNAPQFRKLCGFSGTEWNLENW